MRYDRLKYERIRDLRIDQDLTQKQVAEDLHIAKNTLSQYETGVREIPIEILRKIAVYYDTSIDYLLELTDNPKSYEKKEEKSKGG